jgi:hypothetical protein
MDEFSKSSDSLNQTEEDILYTVSDDALEAAAGIEGRAAAPASVGSPFCFSFPFLPEHCPR